MRLTGEAAMDPRQVNHVRLNTSEAGRDAWGVPKADVVFQLDERDWNRVGHMISEMRAVASALGGTLPEKLEPLPPGRSHHEGGTLRMGTDVALSVVDPKGRFHGIANLFAADASIFPNVGVANPMLTITAVAYHVAANIADTLAASVTQSVDASKNVQAGAGAMEAA